MNNGTQKLLYIFCKKHRFPVNAQCLLLLLKLDKKEVHVLYGIVLLTLNIFKNKIL